MEKECEIVQDLLLSYNDGVLSSSSNELVEKHLKSCNKCQEALGELQNENKKQVEEKEVDYLKNIRNKLNKKTIYICVGAILLFSVVVFNLLVFKNYNATACLMEVYLDDNITEEQLDTIKKSIIAKAEERNSNVEIEYRSKEQERERMKGIVEDVSLLDGLDDGSNVFPAVYYVKANTKSIKDIENGIKTMQGVKSVNTYIDDNPYLLFLYK